MDSRVLFVVKLNCKAYPDEKGIETEDCAHVDLWCKVCIAKPIPMKRELKLRGVLVE